MWKILTKISIIECFFATILGMPKLFDLSVLSLSYLAGRELNEVVLLAFELPH